MIVTNKILIEYENIFRIDIPKKAKQEILTRFDDESINFSEQDIHHQSRKILRKYNIII